MRQFDSESANTTITVSRTGPPHAGRDRRDVNVGSTAENAPSTPTLHDVSGHVDSETQPSDDRHVAGDVSVDIPSHSDMLNDDQACEIVDSGSTDPPANRSPYERTVRFDNEWSRAFRGASPKYKTKRFVLSYVKADKPIEVIQDAIFQYAKDRNVHVRYVRLLKQWDGHNPTYTLRVNVDSRHADTILENENFWPQNVRCREWIPQSQRHNSGAF